MICGNNVKSGVTAAVERFALLHRWHLRTASGGDCDLNAGDDVRRWKPDGVIAEAGYAFAPARFRALPVVRVNTAQNGISARHSVNFDDAACGRLAAEELLRLGPVAGAFVGSLNVAVWSERRMDGFRLALDAAGKDCLVYSQKDKADTNAALARFLRELPKPCGVFAAHDIRARQVAELCRKLKLRIPEDVAVIGVDNDENVCEAVSPTLSSVPDTPLDITASVGWKAAETLEEMMRGNTATGTVFVPPDRVVQRMSTAPYAVLSAPLKKAMEFIRLNACSGIGVRDVVKVSKVSIQLLYLRFYEKLDRTVLEEIHRVRIEKAKELLFDRRRRLSDLPARTGFGSLTALQKAFKRTTGVSMRNWRKANVPVAR
ncbi:MAG: substrate-binding domain-containing protein [Kiritimatiellia bacterium]|jgi:LacI family transcriptional regulator|nr:substrate-binding domain-containing protein [Kiritimatiellia bacterium]